MNSLTTYLFLAALLFSLGIFGVFQRRSLIGMLIAIELMLTGASMFMPKASGGIVSARAFSSPQMYF